MSESGSGPRFPGICHLCNEPVAGEEILDHLRVVHPDVYGDGPPRWPDGRLAIPVLPADARRFEEDQLTGEGEGSPAGGYAVVLFTGSECEEYPGKSCVMDVLGPYTSAEAERVMVHYLEVAPWTAPHRAILHHRDIPR
jgi:hypothetical protein